MTNSAPNSSKPSDLELFERLKDPFVLRALDEYRTRQEAKELSESLYQFLKAAWRIVEPAEYVDGWHIRAICEHLEAVARGRERNLLINIPPRYAKSLTVSVFYPCWRWTWDPKHRFLFASYAESLSIRDNLKCRDLIKSAWYQKRWPLQVKPDVDTKGRFDLTGGGYRIASSVGGATTGEGGDTIAVDDASALDDAYSEPNRAAMLRWWTGTMQSRLNDRKTGSRIVIGQRIHELDLPGHILRNEPGEWCKLILPAEYEPKKAFTNSLGWRDPRTKEGELLWPERVPAGEQQKIKKGISSFEYSGQQQQDPVDAEGGLFAPKYFRHFHGDGDEYVLRQPDGSVRRIPRAAVYTFQTLDTAIQVKESSDFTVCLTAGITLENDLLILDVERVRIPVPEQYKFTQTMRARWPEIGYQFVEPKGSGQGLIQEAEKTPFPFFNLTERLKRNNVPHLITADKKQRAVPVALHYEQGKVYHLAGAPWLADFENELMHFPLGGHDDQVDCLSYAGILLKYGPRQYAGFYGIARNELTRQAIQKLEDAGINPGAWAEDLKKEEPITPELPKLDPVIARLYGFTGGDPIMRQIRDLERLRPPGLSPDDLRRMGL